MGEWWELTHVAGVDREVRGEEEEDGCEGDVADGDLRILVWIALFQDV